jgi:diacylglycerol kinase family enzyme
VGLKGVVRRVDLGTLHARQVSRFLLFVGVGFDAYVAARVRPSLKARIGIAAYYVQVLRSLAAYDFPEFEVVVGSENLTATSCLIASAHSYGGELVLTPDADMCDGYFDLLLVQTRRKWDYARLLLCAKIGKRAFFPWTQRRRVQSVRIAGPRGLWVQADGELAGTLPVEIGLSPAAFPLMVPRKS